ncbi:MAG: endonuclease III domain-containing protein [Acidobacteria bacterium]|nr:endonuclease III domain-containing protein [Acidobacteriota bacterium]
MQFAAREPALEPAGALRRYYQTLFRHLGAQEWWPARTRLEVILGAILAQHTAWRNAALAIKQLRRAGLLKLRELEKASRAEVESCIRPAGFFRQKAAAIRNFLDWLRRAHNGSLNSMLAGHPEEVRGELLKVKGLGEETADAILLYAGRQPFFVADAYTRRILERHALVPSRASYLEVQDFIHRYLPRDHALFNEFHALLVEVGKRYCRRQAPRCEACPLREFLPREAGSEVSDIACLTSRRELRKPRAESRAALV